MEPKTVMVVVLSIPVLALAGCGGQKPLTSGLHIDVTNVGWEKTGDTAWEMVGARVDVDCDIGRMVVTAEHVERDREPSVRNVCRAIRLNPALLRPAPIPPCSEYSNGTVTVTGEWEGRTVDLRFPTCEQGAPGSEGTSDPGRRWAHMLGFYFQGPDPPA
jgi:hypothetical protein